MHGRGTAEHGLGTVFARFRGTVYAWIRHSFCQFMHGLRTVFARFWHSVCTECAQLRHRLYTVFLCPGTQGYLHFVPLHWKERLCG